MRWEADDAYGGGQKHTQDLLRKSEERDYFVRPRCRWEYNTNKELKN
jgi:hypothetical protein